MIIMQNHFKFLHKLTFLFIEAVCMQNEVVLTCPYKRSIGITNIVYDLWWNDYYGWKPFNPFFCTGRTHTSNDCKSTISYKRLQDQCMWKDTCTVVMDYNPCWSEPLYATIYYQCIGLF